MNIIFTFAESDYTGASRMGHSYMQALRKCGHSVIAVIGPFSHEGERRLGDVLEETDFEYIEMNLFNSFWNYRNVSRLKRLMATYAPDCIVSMNQADVKVTALAARQLSIPYVPSVQNLRFFYGNPIFRSFKKWIYERLMQSATLAICSSNATADEHLDRFGLKHEKLVIIPNSIDCEYTRQRADLSVRSEIRKNLGLADDAILLVNTGRISEQKGHLVLLNALCQTAQFSDNERVHLLVVGSARENDLAHSKKVHDLHDKLKFKGRIHFLGWRDDVPEILAACDFYIHSALWEGPPLPLAVLEAMACGLGVVMTDCAGRLPNFVDGLHGWCVAKNDPEALAKRIAQVLELDEVERAEMGRAARELAVSHFDIKVNGARFVDEIEKAVSIYASSRVSH